MLNKLRKETQIQIEHPTSYCYNLRTHIAEYYYEHFKLEILTVTINTNPKT